MDVLWGGETVSENGPTLLASLTLSKAAKPASAPARKLVTQGPSLKPHAPSRRHAAPSAASASVSPAAQRDPARRNPAALPGQLAARAVSLALAGLLLKHAAKASASLIRLMWPQPATAGPAPPGGPDGRTAQAPTLLWLRGGDLRLHDNEALAAAIKGASCLLPAYVFDPREYGQEGGVAARTGAYRAAHLLDSVADLRARLRAMGSELVVRVGRLEEVLPELAAQAGARRVVCQGEVSWEEGAAEAAVARALAAAGGAQLHTVWGGTLFHPADLPFRLQAVPATYAEFGAALGRVAVRPPLKAPSHLPGLPSSMADIAPGDIPSMAQLGFGPAALPSPQQRWLQGAGPAPRGGESTALQQLQAFLQQLDDSGSSNSTSAAAASFAAKISPWLAMGSLSPRTLHQALRRRLGQAAVPLQPAASASGEGGSQQQPGTWLVCELLWRDFFRLTTKKYTMTSTPPAVPTVQSIVPGKGLMGRAAAAAAGRVKQLAAAAASAAGLPALALA